MIREASYADVDQIVSLGLKFIKDSPLWKDYAINVGKMHQYAVRFIREEHKCFFVDERGGKVVAFLSGYATPMIFGDELIAEEQLLFIDPEHKSSARTGIRLMRKFEEWARERDVRILWFTPTSHGADDRWESFCKTLGYTHQGTAFNKRL